MNTQVKKINPEIVMEQVSKTAEEEAKDLFEKMNISEEIREYFDHLRKAVEEESTADKNIFYWTRLSMNSNTGLIIQ